MTTPRSVTAWGSARSGYEGQPSAFVTIALFWGWDDPYCVKATIRYQNTPVVWAWSRDLLAEGFTRAIGAGDVRVEPADEHIAIHLRTNVCTARLLIPAGFLREFLNRTFAITPAGDEYADVDCETELREFLEAA